MPQGSGNLLDVTKTFAICYAETSGSNSDSSWRDSYVRVRVSKIETFSAHLVAHKTYGSLAKTSALEITYAGTLAASMWVSMVDATSNSNFPCALGTNAAQSAGAAASPPTSPSSGVDQADGSSVVVFDTTVMDTSLTYAVCYAETGGAATDSWTDTGLRLTVSKIVVYYGPESTSFARRQWHSPNVMPAINRLPRVANAVVTYVGELATNKYIYSPPW